jgi:hypothetical protein
MTKTSKIMSTTASTTSISPKRTLFASEEHGNPLEHTTPTKSHGSPSKDTPTRITYRIRLRLASRLTARRIALVDGNQVLY